MPVVLKIDPHRKVVYSAFYGEVTDAEVLGHGKAIGSDPDFNPEFSEIVDFSSVTNAAISESTLAALALYFYSREVLPLVATYLSEGNNPDQPGRFLQWLYPRKPVNTFKISGRWLDIGSKETLEIADKTFAKS